MTSEKSENGRSAVRSRDPDFIGAEAAMHRAARRARRRAAANGTPIAIVEDGKIVWVMVDEDDEC